MRALTSNEVVRPIREEYEKDRRYLLDRMQKPQRHRLLHGYPLAAAMRSRKSAADHEEPVFDATADRRLLVGVLPHPFCNPAVTGCGFCTFPHEAFHAARSAAVVDHVVREIEQRLRLDPSLERRPVSGLYFGGGTANLTPAESFRRLCQALHKAFDFSRAEVTLEGVPAYFVKRRPLLLEILREELPARHYRISMGIQTFDESQLRRMGRLAFGTAATFQEVVSLGHRLGFTVSADLLFNLPGQSLEQMRQDLTQAAEIGLDHLGLYHLVVFAGLGTTWSRDPELLAALPANEQGCDHWLALREQLLNGDFHQTTLTNFERREFRLSENRFQYEESSFQPDRFDMVGFGPSGISVASRPGFGTALKTLNPVTAESYMDAVRSRATPWDRYFHYEPGDLRVFHLTRRLAALDINREEYRRLFGVDPVLDFDEECQALQAEQLIEITPTSLRPTPRGMFYADSVAALFAARQIRELRSAPEEHNSNGRGHM
jgi:oxygen-independent coproporphyrinogen-3 oxidase